MTPRKRSRQDAEQVALPRRTAQFSAGRTEGFVTLGLALWLALALFFGSVVAVAGFLHKNQVWGRIWSWVESTGEADAVFLPKGISVIDVADHVERHGAVYADVGSDDEVLRCCVFHFNGLTRRQIEVPTLTFSVGRRSRQWRVGRLWPESGVDGDDLSGRLTDVVDLKKYRWMASVIKSQPSVVAVDLHVSALSDNGMGIVLNVGNNSYQRQNGEKSSKPRGSERRSVGWILIGWGIFGDCAILAIYLRSRLCACVGGLLLGACLTLAAIAG